MRTILDTNVISEFMRPRPDPRVIRWVDSMPRASLWTTAVTVMELRAGIEQTVDPVRRHVLEKAFTAQFTVHFEGRVFSFDPEAAAVAGHFLAILHGAGQSPDIRDVQIAAMSHRLSVPLATRNIRHFALLPIETIDPWTADPSA
ncbi:MAG: type II toxin-antitoxin system VapC family toxin [Myxococcales bacterium]|nr:type II toxin-antitoxin system VapC family toxin [Myxococcales bacterium]